MIKGINSSGRYINVNGGYAGASPYINQNQSAAGMLRWNSTTSNLEVNDGISWVALPMNYASIELTSETESLLEWARQKRAEEARYKELAEQNPTFREVYEKFQIVKALVTKQENNGSKTA